MYELMLDAAMKRERQAQIRQTALETPTETAVATRGAGGERGLTSSEGEGSGGPE